MKRVNLIYWNNTPNFGDVLSPFIIHSLSGMEIKHINRYWNTKKFISNFLYNCIHRLWNENKEICFPYTNVMLGVGSILTWVNFNSTVWGSGFMKYSDKVRQGVFNKYYCVRGPKSAQKLKENGITPPNYLGDPALLLPVIIEPKNSKKVHKIGIIPHIRDYKYFQENYSRNYHIINLATDDIQHIVDEIISCEVILSTSLHGIIVSHAYCIPALWIRKGYIYTDGFKFDDYFMSVGLEPYKGTDNIEELLASKVNVLEYFEKYKEQSIPSHSILQERLKDLFMSFPLPLIRKYQSVRDGLTT